MDVLQRCQEIKAQVEVELAAASGEEARMEILVQGLYRLSDTVLAKMGGPSRSESYQAGRNAVVDLLTFLCLSLVRAPQGRLDLLTVLAEVAEASQDPIVHMKLSVYSRQLSAQAGPASAAPSDGHSWCGRRHFAGGAALSLVLAAVLFQTLHSQKSAVLSRDGGPSQESRISGVSQEGVVAQLPPGWRDTPGGSLEPVAKHPSAARAEKGEQVTKIRVVANQVLVPVTVRNGGETVKVTLLLDTGSTRTALCEQFAGKLGIDLGRAKGSLVEVADGRVVHSRLATVDLLSVGSRTAPSFEMEFYPYSGSDQGFDGFLGMDFLGKQRYQLDVENEVIRWF